MSGWKETERSIVIPNQEETDALTNLIGLDLNTIQTFVKMSLELDPKEVIKAILNLYRDRRDIQEAYQ